MDAYRCARDQSVHGNEDRRDDTSSAFEISPNPPDSHFAHHDDNDKQEVDIPVRKS